MVISDDNNGDYELGSTMTTITKYNSFNNNPPGKMTWQLEIQGGWNRRVTGFKRINIQI